MESNYTIIEIRLIQSLWQTHTVQYIASMLDRTALDVQRQIEKMDKKGIILFKPKTLDRKLKKKAKEENWALQLHQKRDIKIVSHENKIPVYIDKRTTVYVNPGTDIAAIKRKYEYLKLKP